MKKFIFREPIHKGFSSDRKFCVTDEDGKQYLLRISDRIQYDRKLFEHNMMKKASSIGIPMCLPLDFGISEEGVYSVQSWINGQDAETVLQTLSDNEKYAYGIEAGRILKKIHSIPAPAEQPEWESYYQKKIDQRIKKYLDCSVKFDGAEHMIAYIEENRHLLKNRPQSFLHRDFHRGNLMIDRQGKLTVIDFGKADFGDPWEDMKAIRWDVDVSPYFASGRINGYFDNEVPSDFWKLLALYCCVGIISSIPWAIPFGQGEIDTMLHHAKELLESYNDMNHLTPNWYIKPK